MISVFSCDTDDQSEVLNDAKQAGGLVSIQATPNSSILGNPEPGADLDTAKVTITNAYLKLTVKIASGDPSAIKKIEIVKSYDGGPEVFAGESSTYPFVLEITNLEDLLSGTGVVEDDLRIGKILKFRTKVHNTDGTVYYYNKSLGEYSMTVNCASNLAGNYLVTTYRDNGNIINHGLEAITEVTPGYYKTTTTGHWLVNAIASDQGFNFNDACGILSVPAQKLAQGTYSNDVDQANDLGKVSANGDLEINYTVVISGAVTVFKNVYIKQ